MTLNALKLDHHSDYLEWRKQKLANYPLQPKFISINDLKTMNDDERSAIARSVASCNFVLFEASNPRQVDPQTLLAFGQQLGLLQNDHNICSEEIGITALQVKENASRRYIPYTNKPLSWHTDGYYNAPEQQIRAWMLYCARDASDGGENELMDHEIAYIRLRDHDPRLIKALQQPQAMTIPANIEDCREIRAEQTGPVFSFDENSQRLHMRYSARSRNIVWYDSPETADAAAFLKDLFANGDEYRHRLKLKPGQGVLSNNILHRREGFTDAATGPGRLLYRARYYNSINALGT